MELKKSYVEKESLLSQSRKVLISGFLLHSGTPITPLLLFYLQWGLFCTKKQRFVEYTQMICFYTFVRSAVGARRQNEEEPNSGVFEETMKLLVKSSYGYQILDCSHNTVTSYLSDKKTHQIYNSKLFEELDHVHNALHEAELPREQILRKDPFLVRIIILLQA